MFPTISVIEVHYFTWSIFMSNSQNLPFLGIIAVGGSLSEAAIAYHDAAIGQNAVAITDRGNSFLFMSNAHPDETVMSNPITGELDLRDVPQALSAVQFQSKSSAKVAARYNVCAGDDGKSGCGTHLIYDCKDVIKYCPMCNESLSSEKNDEEISDVLSFEELGDVITAPEDIEIANQVSESASKDDEEDEDEDDEDISFNDVSDEDEEDDEDYESESSGLTDISGGAEPFDLTEMSDDEVAEFEGDENPYDDVSGELSESASVGDNTDDSDILISNRELEAIRDELISEARHEAHALASKSSNNMREPNEDEFVVKCDSLVAISRTQTKALNKYRALLVSKVPMSVVASSDSSMGFATLASDAKVFRHNVMTGDLIDGNSQVSTRKSPQFIESLSSTHDHSIADLYQCTSKDCAVYIVTSAQSPVHCPMCASDLKDPEDIEEAIVPVLEDDIQDEEIDTSNITSTSNTDGIDDSGIDLDDFDISSLEDDTELNTSNISNSSDETTDGDEISSDANTVETGKKVKVADLKAYRDAKLKSDDAENDAVEDYEQLVASGISAQKNMVNMSLLAETVTETDNTKAEFLNIVYCGSLSSVDSNNHTVRDDTWTAFYKGTPIAFATLASSIQHKGIFHDPAFAEATVASAKVNGIKQSLTDMGFKPFVAKIKVKDNINKLVAAQVETAKAELTEKTKVEFDDYDGRLLAALSTAAVGINRGFFRNLTNPVKVALWNSLSSAGVRNPETLIDNVFSTQADSYHKTLFEKAKEIVSKPLEIQNELTAAVVGTNYTSTASSSHSYTSNQTVEDSLQQVGHPTTGLNTSNSVSVSSSAGNSENTNQMDTRILKVVSSLGRRR